MRLPPPTAPWRLRRLPVCASTERELERWLAAGASAAVEGGQHLAVLARHQRHGHGQQGRPWLAPDGGVWLSAALPWPSSRGAALGLAVAVGVALQIESLGLEPRIKWPNDLLLEGRKLAGLLPRLRLRGGRVRWAQVGLGVNGVNRVPAGAINLATALGGGAAARGRSWHPQAVPRRLFPLLLAGLDWAVAQAQDPQAVCAAAEARLWRPAEGVPLAGQWWQVEGLDPDGALRLRRGSLLTRVHRQF